MLGIRSLPFVMIGWLQLVRLWLLFVVCSNIIRLIITMTDFHIYTRKEIVAWVQSQTRYKFQDLRNGVFFCKMLAQKFPEQASALRYNPAPLSEYDCTNNLNLMKKVLNRKGLQPNLNVQTVLTSKNNFQLARWLRTLIEPPNDTPPISNYSSMPPRDSIQSFRELPQARSPDQTPRKTEEKGKKKMESAEREKEARGSLSKVKRLSMAKSEAAFFKEKKPLRTQLKIPIHRRDKKAEESNVRFYETQVISNKIDQANQQDSMNEVLYERALEESIESLSKIIEKIKSAASKDYQSLSELKQAVQKAIFNK